jgi:ribonucleoside-diphosphate reductase alpha chain
LEPWHTDILDFLECKLPHGGNEKRRARDLFYALWVPDLFMERVRNDEPWSLMCPSECPGLSDVYGDDFKELYEKYEREGRMTKTLPAQDVWFAIIKSQIETGTPYMTYKDSSNKKSNQKNVGVIKSSNLCTEIIEYSDSSKYACCVLSSVVLPTFVDKEKRTFDHAKLASVVKTITVNLNKLIDMNYYPDKETKASNMSERPIGIGVQGLGDVFFKLGIAYESEEAIDLDREIVETIYFSALQTSMELSKEQGPYPTFEGSPYSKGKFQFDLWKEFPTDPNKPCVIKHSGLHNWEKLRKDIRKHGLRNSLVTALMPTATTSQIMGSAAEAFEPMTSNCYKRSVKAGEYIVVNPYLSEDLIKLGLWDERMRETLISENGSVQNIPGVPENLKKVYKTVWEIPQQSLIAHSIARAPYIDQSQSLNLYFADGDPDKITRAHFYGWSNGLKTGSYYIRTKPAAESASFTVTKTDADVEESGMEHATEHTEEPPVCDSCSG